MHQRLQLGNRTGTVAFEVSSIETAPPVHFKPLMQYHCLSPVCVSRTREDGSTEYVSPEDMQFGELLLNNLVRKEKPCN